MDGVLKIILNIYAIVAVIRLGNEAKRDDHINRGCYADKTGQYKLDNKNHFFNSYSCCSRNPFIEYGDIETDMEKLGQTMIGTLNIFLKQSNFML